MPACMRTRTQGPAPQSRKRSPAQGHGRPCDPHSPTTKRAWIVAARTLSEETLRSAKSINTRRWDAWLLGRDKQGAKSTQRSPNTRTSPPVTRSLVSSPAVMAYVDRGGGRESKNHERRVKRGLLAKANPFEKGDKGPVITLAESPAAAPIAAKRGAASLVDCGANLISRQLAREHARMLARAAAEVRRRSTVEGAGGRGEEGGGRGRGGRATAACSKGKPVRACTPASAWGDLAAGERLGRRRGAVRLGRRRGAVRLGRPRGRCAPARRSSLLLAARKRSVAPQLASAVSRRSSQAQCRAAARKGFDAPQLARAATRRSSQGQQRAAARTGSCAAHASSRRQLLPLQSEPTRPRPRTSPCSTRPLTHMA
jgi:hypothetical protein